MLNALACRRSQGYTLVEMMVALTIGLLLTTAVTSLVVANINNTNSVVQGMRVTEESRALTEIITRELRRARYDASASKKIASGATGTVFNAITPTTVNVASDCIKYSYDADFNGAITAGEFRMISRAVDGAGRGYVLIGRFDSAGAVSCTAGNVTIITSDDIDVSCLRFVSATTATAMTSSSGFACYDPVPATPVTLPTIPAGSLYFSMRMSLKTDALTTASRRTDGTIMIRSPVIGP